MRPLLSRAILYVNICRELEILHFVVAINQDAMRINSGHLPAGDKFELNSHCVLSAPNFVHFLFAQRRRTKKIK